MSKYTIEGLVEIARENGLIWPTDVRSYLTALIKQERQDAARKCLAILRSRDQGAAQGAMNNAVQNFIVPAGGYGGVAYETAEDAIRAHFKLEKK